MTQFSFDDNDLKAAAEIVSDALLDSLPKPSEIRFDLSDEFVKKMDVLCAKARRRARMRRVWKRAAMVLLAVLLSLGVWLAVDTDARAAVVNWVLEVYESHVVYRYYGEGTLDPLPLYSLTWMPDNYTLVEDFIGRKFRSQMYEDPETGSVLLLYYNMLYEGTLTVYADFETREKVVINGIPGEYYSNTEDSIMHSLHWIDEKNGLAFSLDTDISLDKSDMLRMAESVKLCETPKLKK